jgi:hypothetical protein
MASVEPQRGLEPNSTNQPTAGQACSIARGLSFPGDDKRANVTTVSGRDVSGDIAPQSSLGTSADPEDAKAVEGMTSLGDVQLARYGGKHDKLHFLISGHWATERLDSATLPRYSGYTGLAYKPATTLRTHPTLPIRPILPKFRHLWDGHRSSSVPGDPTHTRHTVVVSKFGSELRFGPDRCRTGPVVRFKVRPTG